MSTIVYQDLQSCFESHIIETTILKLRVPTPTAIENINEKCYQHQDTKNFSSNKNDLGGWSSIENLSNNSSNPKDSMEKENYSYVHPLSKQPLSSRLSEKSLAICTENLGSETGTDNITENNIFSFSSPPSSTQKTDIRVESSPPLVTTKYKVISTTNSESSRKLPPLLTTLRGSNSLQVLPHREGGRLIIKAVESPIMHTYFQAERSNGRLRLCVLTDESFATTIDEENEELKVENDTFESDTSDEEEKEEEYEEEEEESGNYMKREMDGKSHDVEVDIGIGKCQSVRSCKEARQGNKFFCDWRNPLWVATS